VQPVRLTLKGEHAEESEIFPRGGPDRRTSFLESAMQDAGCHLARTVALPS